MSVEEFFNDVCDGNLEHAAARLKDFGEKELKSFKSSVLELVSGMELSGGATLWDAAVTAVKTEEPLDKTNDEKHASARDAIIATLTDAGIEAIKSVVDVVIKLAVNRLKKALA